jgi:hypothetical protein
MKFMRLTAFAAFFVVALLAISSCEKEADSKRDSVYQKNGIILSGAQVVPASTTSATGTMDVSYDKGSKTLLYKVTWSQLTGNPTGFGVYGLAPAGYAVSPTAPIQTISTTGLTASGTYTAGSLLADGVYVKEQDILNGLYYVMIRTAANPNGELRAQVRFQ